MLSHSICLKTTVTRLHLLESLTHCTDRVNMEDHAMPQAFTLPQAASIPELEITQRSFLMILTHCKVNSLLTSDRIPTYSLA